MQNKKGTLLVVSFLQWYFVKAFIHITYKVKDLQVNNVVPYICLITIYNCIIETLGSSMVNLIISIHPELLLATHRHIYRSL